MLTGVVDVYCCGLYLVGGLLFGFGFSLFVLFGYWCWLICFYVCCRFTFATVWFGFDLRVGCFWIGSLGYCRCGLIVCLCFAIITLLFMIWVCLCGFVWFTRMAVSCAFGCVVCFVEIAGLHCGIWLFCSFGLWYWFVCRFGVAFVLVCLMWFGVSVVFWLSLGGACCIVY